MSIPSIFTKSVDAASNGLAQTVFNAGKLRGRLEVAFNRAARATFGAIDSSTAATRSLLTGEFLLKSRGISRPVDKQISSNALHHSAHLFSITSLLVTSFVGAPFAIAVAAALVSGIEGFLLPSQVQALSLAGRHDIEQARLKKEAAAAVAATAEPPVIAAEQSAPAPKPGA